VLRKFEELLLAHPQQWPQSANVRFVELTESALIVEASCAFATADADEFAGFRQDALLGLMQIVDDSGAHFARPARTVLFAAPAQAEAVSGVVARPIAKSSAS
jgi:hypothetical protein